MAGERGQEAVRYISGAGRDLAAQITTHLFVVVPNNSGSTFLKEALRTCPATWNIEHEGWRMLAFAGPQPWEPTGPVPPNSFPALLWASEARWMRLLTDPSAYDWPRTRQAWYFQAFGQNPDASVFVAKWPPFVLCADQLREAFPDAKFLFMVRNPYATCEGICRKYGHLADALAAEGRSLEERAATHVVNCFARQRQNLARHGDCSVFFTYEAMCAAPERVTREIAALVPALRDLSLRQRLGVKGNTYNEMLTNMNARQIESLTPQQFERFNRVFQQHENTLGYFGYELMASA